MLRKDIILQNTVKERLCYACKGIPRHSIFLHLDIHPDKERSAPKEGTVEIVVVPSFNPHLSVTGEKYYHKSISPIITRVVQHGVEKCMVVTLDGSVVGDKTILSQTL